MTIYLDRSAWTITSASGQTLTGTILRGVAVHWPGTSIDAFGVEPKTVVAQRIRHYRQYHVNTRGWRDIGYNLVIDQAGRIWIARSTTFRGNLVGAHCASAANPDANHEYVGVLLLLGATEEPTNMMIEAFQDWRHNHFLRGWPLRIDLREHSKVPGAQTACAGPQVRALLATGALHQPPDTEDDVTPQELRTELDRFFNGTVGDYIDGKPMSRDEALHRAARFAGANTNTLRYRVLPNLMDPDELAAALLPHLPSHSIPLATMVDALKQVLGSLDET